MTSTLHLFLPVSLGNPPSNSGLYRLAYARDERAVRRRQRRVSIGQEGEVASVVVAPVWIFAWPEQVARGGAKVVLLKWVFPGSIVKELDAFGIHIEYQGEAVGYFQPSNLLLGDLAQVHQQAADRILAARYQHALTLLHRLRHYLFGEVGYGTVHAILERFRLGKLPVEGELPTLD
jgi:hypothetical protein